MLRRIAADQGSVEDHDKLRDLVQAGQVRFVPDAEAGGERLIITDERGAVAQELTGGARVATLRAEVAKVTPPSAPPPPRADLLQTGNLNTGPGIINDNRPFYYQPVFNMPAASAPAQAAAPAFTVPYPPNPLFTGRDAELARIAAGLAAGRAVAVVGAGGLGKTQLAVEYAHAARDKYPGGVCWLLMDPPEGIAGQVAALAGPGGLDLPGAAGLDFAGQVAAVRRAWQGPEARLLIFDNLEDPKVLQEWRPAGGGARVLITSRRQTWAATSGVQPLPLPPLARPASLGLLLGPRAMSRDTTPAALLADTATAADADGICEALGDLPLALAVAGAYLEATPSATLARYREQIEQAPLARLETDLEEALPTGHEPSILKTFALSYDKLDTGKLDDILARALPNRIYKWLYRKRSKPYDALALTLLHRAALLAPAPIPRRLLLCATDLNPDDTLAQEDMDRALLRLAALGLIEDLDDGPRLHPLLSAYARLCAPAREEDQMAVEAALRSESYRLLQAGYPLAGLPYLPHLRQVALVADVRGNASAATLLNNLGSLLSEQGDLIGARPYYERALAIYEQTLGSTHPYTAGILNNLGWLLAQLGDAETARSLVERALAIREQTLGPTHPDTAISLSVLGLLLKSSGDAVGARSYLERALAVTKQAYGPVHPATANRLGNWGSLLQEQDDTEAARSYYEQALAINEATYGSNHPAVAGDLIKLGALLKKQDNLVSARRYLEQALAIYEQALGPTHTRTASSLSWLGSLLQKEGDLAEARPYLERALAIYEQVLGLAHPDTATSLSNLAMLLYQSDDPAAALPLLERALAVRQQTFGLDHPDTQDTQYGLDLVRQALAELGDAES
jgi:tetratricopeptide (TPR) repeat protein